MSNKKQNEMQEDTLRLHRRRRRQVLGAVLTFLVIAGVVGIIYGIGQIFIAATDDSEEKADFEQRIGALVMLDPVPFDTIENASSDILVEAALWMTLSNEDTTSFERDELGMLVVPAIDVERNAAMLYGPNYKLTHRSFSDMGMDFEFDTERQSYKIPITGQVGNYIPYVEEITKESKNVKRLLVGYIPPSSGEYVITRTDNKPVKYMEYLFTKIEDEYYLTAIEISDKIAENSQQQSSSSNVTSDIIENDPNIILEQATDDGTQAAKAELDAAKELENSQSQPAENAE